MSALYFSTDPKALCERLLHGSDDHETSVTLRKEAAALIDQMAIELVLVQPLYSRRKLEADLATALSEQIRLSLEVLTLTNERDEARALGRMA